MTENLHRHLEIFHLRGRCEPRYNLTCKQIVNSFVDVEGQLSKEQQTKNCLIQIFACSLTPRLGGQVDDGLNLKVLLCGSFKLLIVSGHWWRSVAQKK